MMEIDFRFSKNDKIVVLTGAGVSAESGLKTFRDNNGLWENHRVEDVATPEAFERNPKMVWRFYRMRYEQSLEVKPNPGHYALVEMERKLGKNFQLITQNVDGLHEVAGNRNVYEMHGSLRKVFCVKCNSKFNISNVDIKPELPKCPKCKGLIRPDIVWFGEMPYFMSEIDQILHNADVFIVLGTSGLVYPAAHFLMVTHYKGTHTIGVNLEKPQNINFIDEFYQGKTGELLPVLIKEWLPE